MCTQFQNRYEAHDFYRSTLADSEAQDANLPPEKRGVVQSTMRYLGQNDLFYMLIFLLRRPDIDDDWLFSRCQDVQSDPDEHLDLWAREHYKSTIITFGYTILELMNNSNLTFGIFSHTRPIAKAFMSHIKQEFEKNELLLWLYPDVLWADPRKEAPKWSMDDGVILKRTSNKPAATIEAWGLVDGQPTSKHFDRLIYDDVVTRESVQTPEAIKKTTAAYRLSLNLGVRHLKGGRKRIIGTRYNFADTYRTIIKSGIPTRIHPATDDGTPTGDPIFLTQEEINTKRREMGPYVFSCQMLQNPTADEAQNFSIEWLRYYRKMPTRDMMNVYILVDPAGDKKKTSDYTVMLVIGLLAPRNYYLLDGLRDRMNLTQRADALMRLHRKWKPEEVGYEKYGKDSDIEHIEFVQDQKSYMFDITPLGGILSKNDRIRRLIPVFESGRFYLPQQLLFHTLDNRLQDLVSIFIEDEYIPFPANMDHDDTLDDMARILDEDLGAEFPDEDFHAQEAFQDGEESYDPVNYLNRGVNSTTSPIAIR